MNSFKWGNRAGNIGLRKAIKSSSKAMALSAMASAGALFLNEHYFRTTPREPVVWSPGVGETFKIANAHVIDLEKGVVESDHDLLVSNGRIEKIFSPGNEAITADKTIDVNGMYIIPGLINAHCHMLWPGTFNLSLEYLSSVPRQVERNFEECVVHGVTTVRDTGNPPRLLRRYIERVEREDLLGPRVYYAGSFIGPPGCYPSDYCPPFPEILVKRWGQIVQFVNSPSEARDAVKRNLEEGSSCIKVAFDCRSLLYGEKPLNILDDESLKAVVDEAHDNGVKVLCHHRYRGGLKRINDFNVDDGEHCAADEVLDDSDVEAFVAAGRCIVPTIQVPWGLSFMSPNDPYNDDPQVREFMADRLQRMRTVYADVCEPAVYRAIYKMEMLYRNPKYTERRHILPVAATTVFTKAAVIGPVNLNKFYHAGALIGCGNDGGCPQLFTCHLGLEMLLMDLATDMEPIDILRSATINNARIMGIEDELGSVAEGKIADLVLLSGNPLEGLEPIMSPQAVFKGGKLAFNAHPSFLRRIK